VNNDLVTTIDIAPTVVDLAGGKAADRQTMQGCLSGPHFQRGGQGRAPKGWRSSFMCEYFSENAMPWLIGMSYKAIRTKRHKYIPLDAESLDGVECDELYDLRRIRTRCAISLPSARSARR